MTVAKRTETCHGGHGEQPSICLFSRAFSETSGKPCGGARTVPRVGALAIDERQGNQYGWAEGPEIERPRRRARRGSEPQSSARRRRSRWKSARAQSGPRRPRSDPGSPTDPDGRRPRARRVCSPSGWHARRSRCHRPAAARFDGDDRDAPRPRHYRRRAGSRSRPRPMRTFTTGPTLSSPSVDSSPAFRFTWLED